MEAASRQGPNNIMTDYTLRILGLEARFVLYKFMFVLYYVKIHGVSSIALIWVDSSTQKPCFEVSMSDKYLMICILHLLQCHTT